MKKIIVYTKTGCPWCEGVKDYFNEKGLSFEEKNVTESGELFQEMQKLSGQTKAPVVFIDGVMLADTDRDQVDEYLLKHPENKTDSE